MSLNWTKKNCFAAARRNPTKVCNIYIKTATWRHSSINDWFVVQLVIKPWWKDWPSLMEFLIDILVDVDVGGWHLKVPTSSNVFPPFFLVVFTGPNKFVPWIIIICIKMHEKTHLLSYLDVYFILLHNAISFIYYGLESEWGKLMA